MTEEPICILSPSRSERHRELVRLYEALIELSVELCVLTTTTSKASQRHFVSGIGSTKVYMFRSTVSAIPFADLISSIKPWHFNSLAVIIGKPGTTKALCESGLDDLSLPIPELSDSSGLTFRGYFFPVDDEIVLYGDQDISNAVGRM
jgi:hypothetical protein